MSNNADGERKFPVAISWIAFLALVIIGAGFITSPVPGRQVIGFAMLFAPLIAFSVLMGLYYWRSKRHMQAAVETEIYQSE
jgi:hypothetical protein